MRLERVRVVEQTEEEDMADKDVVDDNVSGCGGGGGGGSWGGERKSCSVCLLLYSVSSSSVSKQR